MKIVTTELCSVPSFGSAEACLMAVLTQDDTGLYACYLGIGPRSVVDDHEARDMLAWKIAFGGKKLDWRKCREHFPLVPEARYRA